eukprot:GHVN01052229.1.p1 GENE.GHVN01052229.1~~GHVN01052229.1.p1  ORF type:complete len:144 (-),score=5.72 GHVN01052229.1:727-1158(-)
MHFDMTEYALMIIQEYDDGVANSGDFSPQIPIAAKSRNLRRSPITIDIRRNYKRVATPKACKKSVEFVQKIIGMMIWLVICGRWDLIFSVSCMSTRVNNWDDECWLTLNMSIGYLRRFPNLMRQERLISPHFNVFQAAEDVLR